MTEERKLTIGPAWIASVRLWLAEQGPGAQKELAKRVGCSSPAITYMLDGRQQSSKLVGPISRAIGVPTPSAELLSDDEIAVLGRYKALSAAEKSVITATLDAFIAAKLGDA